VFKKGEPEKYLVIYPGIYLNQFLENLQTRRIIRWISFTL